MNRDPNVITFLDRFTVTTEDGDPDVYSPWMRVPSGCKVFEFVYDCLARQSLDIDISIEGSIDKTSVESQVMGTIGAVGMPEYLEDWARRIGIALKAERLSSRESQEAIRDYLEILIHAGIGTDQLYVWLDELAACDRSWASFLSQANASARSSLSELRRSVTLLLEAGKMSELEARHLLIEINATDESRKAMYKDMKARMVDA